MPSENRMSRWIVPAVYCAVFYAFWALYVLIWSRSVQAALPPLAATLTGEGIKLASWAVPACLLVSHYRQDVEIPLPGLFARPSGSPMPFVYGLLLLAGAPLLGALVRQDFSLQLPPLTEWISTVLFVGISEELVFRGWLFNHFRKSLSFQTANILQAALFVLIHFPTWMRSGSFFEPFTLLVLVVGIFLRGWIFGYLVQKSRSLWPAILLHMVNNAVAIVLA